MEGFSGKLILENGTEFYGQLFGAHCESLGEIVFNTSMAGYQEIITDPSYMGQSVVMTYPLIGNYGITAEDNESRQPFLSGLIVREVCELPSNFRYTSTLSELLEEHGIPGISGIDTRKLTRIIRSEGSQKVLIAPADMPKEKALQRIAQGQIPKDVVARVSCRKRWYSRTANAKFNVVAVDCGIKLNIVRSLNKLGCNVTIVPHTATAADIAALSPDGLFLSNGPGDPEVVKSVIELVGAMRGTLPIFGICLGHQIISLSYGARTYKMKFGHRGGNHPVKNLLNGKVEITSQNHSYAVDRQSLEGTGLELTHINLLDDTAEGVRCVADKIFSVQYHPESAPGPEDSEYLFEQFIEMMQRHKEGKQHA